MRLSGFLPEVGRRVMVAMGVAVMLMVAASAHAQTPPAAAQATPTPAPDAMKFSGEPVLLIWQIKPDKADDFTAFLGELKAALSKSEKADVKAQGESLHYSRVVIDPAIQGPAIFVLSLEPSSATQSYDPVKMLYDSGVFTREQSDALYKRLTEAHMQLAPWILKKIG